MSFWRIREIFVGKHFMLSFFVSPTIPASIGVRELLLGKAPFMKQEGKRLVRIRGCAGYMGYPPDTLIVYLFRYLVLLC
jgi:hypothetical protein